MAVHTIKKGLDLPLLGEPQQVVAEGRRVTRIAVMADDFVGMRPRLVVRVGDVVKRGQLLFEDRKCAGVRHTSPGAGRVVAINRGDFRAFQSVVIELTPSEVEGKPNADELQSFEAFTGKPAAELTREQVVALLAESGLWTALRRRPFGTVPSPSDAAPYAIFVAASDSNPHAPSIDKVLEGREAEFAAGLAVVSKLAAKVFLCKRAGTRVSAQGVTGVSVEEFAGPHPSGSIGFQIHTLAPVNRERVVWHLAAQDVAAIGSLFQSGKLEVSSVVALGGPVVLKPRLIRSRLGACIDELVEGEVQGGENRQISGSVLSGRKASGEIFGFLGRYHQQISMVQEGRDRKFLGWLTPGGDRYSVSRAYASALDRSKKFALTTNINGSPRAIMPIGIYEQVFPFDIQATYLLRAVMSQDLEKGEELGMLELEPEDLDLCTFVCPGKSEFQTVLRDNLESIRKDG